MKELAKSFCSAVIFYTIIPLPYSWTTSWTRIARWASLIGLLLGSLLGLFDKLLELGSFSDLIRGAAITALWLGLTGGLHLDGAMDTADGLGVTDTAKRLAVMKDSATGAYGAMVAIVILLLKTALLSNHTDHNWLFLILAMGWGRWGQLIAIALYPYLRKTGKGAFHRENMQIFIDIFAGSAIILVSSIYLLFLIAFSQLKMLVIISGCAAIALIIGYYFYYRFKGHTGDTYGATVEWSEVLILFWLNYVTTLK